MADKEKQKLMAKTFGTHYKLIRKLGSGAFGEIYLGRHVKTGKRVAIKLEKSDLVHPQLRYEYKLYRYFLKGEKKDCGIPNVLSYAPEGEKNVMVMDLLGPSLEDLFTMCSKKLSLKSVLFLADQMLERIELVHKK